MQKQSQQLRGVTSSRLLIGFINRCRFFFLGLKPNPVLFLSAFPEIFAKSRSKFTFEAGIIIPMAYFGVLVQRKKITPFRTRCENFVPEERQE